MGSIREAGIFSIIHLQNISGVIYCHKYITQSEFQLVIIFCHQLAGEMKPKSNQHWHLSNFVGWYTKGDKTYETKNQGNPI